MNTEQSSLALRYRKLVARLKDIVQCVICLEIVRCPAVQCEAGHLMCGQCRDNLEENTCPTCRQPLIAVRNLAVEQVVEVLPKECSNEDHGCQELLIADEVDTHRVTCSCRQFSCPQPLCPWVGYKQEIIGHMRNTHQRQILSSNKQTVKVPVKWDEVSSWSMVLNDEILVLKFSVDRATNFLLGSFECLGLLNPSDSFKYQMTVKRGDCETTLSGNIAPERSATDRQSIGEWDCVISRSSYDDHPESESFTSSRYIKVDVAIEDNRGIAAAQASGDVELQTQVSDDDEVWTQARDDDSEMQTQASDGGVGDSTRQVGGGNQSDQTADRVIHKLGCWFAFGYGPLGDYTPSMSKIYHIITGTKTNITSALVKSIDEISNLIYDDFSENHLSIERYLYRLSRDLAEINLKFERVRAAGGNFLDFGWKFPYLLIMEQVVYQAFTKSIHQLPAIDEVELEKLLTARERRMRDESALRMLWRADAGGGQDLVKNLIAHIGRAHKKSNKEISSLQSEAATIPWSDITTIT